MNQQHQQEITAAREQISAARAELRAKELAYGAAIKARDAAVTERDKLTPALAELETQHAQARADARLGGKPVPVAPPQLAQLRAELQSLDSEIPLLDQQVAAREQEVEAAGEKIGAADEVLVDIVRQRAFDALLELIDGELTQRVWRALALCRSGSRKPHADRFSVFAADGVISLLVPSKMTVGALELERARALEDA
jgi:hypothetical protein